MVDWSKYDDEARKTVETQREEAKERSELLARLKNITRMHAERLREAGVAPSAHPAWWHVAVFSNGLPAYINSSGDWSTLVYVTQYIDPWDRQTPFPRGGTYQAPEHKVVEPPFLDEDALAHHLAWHYSSETGK